MGDGSTAVDPYTEKNLLLHNRNAPVWERSRSTRVHLSLQKYFFLLSIPYSLFPIPYSLFPIPYSLLPILYYLFPIPYSLFPIPYSLLPIPYYLLPITYYLLPVPCSLFPVPYSAIPSDNSKICPRLTNPKNPASLASGNGPG